jgi:hypothetical protein
MAERKRKKSDLEVFAGYERQQEKQIKPLEERIVSQFYIISEGLIDQIKLLAEGDSGILDRLTVIIDWSGWKKRTNGSIWIPAHCEALVCLSGVKYKPYCGRLWPRRMA